MHYTEKQIKNLFLQQSYDDSWYEYVKSLKKNNFPGWDYVVLTASNEDQAQGYREQIKWRQERNLIPKSTTYVVLPDPFDERVGSGGATFHVLKYISEAEKEWKDFSNKRILVIHSGGDSKRVPQYSACGKLFSPVPRTLPDGRRSTLFDEFIIGMSGVAARMRDGMLVLSGDVLLLFNTVQLDFQHDSAAAISIKEPVEKGKNHGVFLKNGEGNVGRFLHKQSINTLEKLGAVNENRQVDIDTGAIILNSKVLDSLFSLISTDGKVDEKKFRMFVNDKARISFYGDFLYPLATDSTLEDYYNEKPEGTMCDELKGCRTRIWEVLHEYNLKLICLSPAEFIHFGTTQELLKLMTKEIADYSFLGWNQSVCSNSQKCACSNSFIEDEDNIPESSYIEDSIIKDHAVIGENSIIAGVTLDNTIIPDNVVLHGLKLHDGKFVVRIYGVNDNPKEKTGIFGITFEQFMECNSISPDEIWDQDNRSLWNAKLYSKCDTVNEAVDMALNLYYMATEDGNRDLFFRNERISLAEGFNQADAKAIIEWQQSLNDCVNAERFINCLKEKLPIDDVRQMFGNINLNDKVINLLLERAKTSDSTIKSRIYYYLSKILKNKDSEDMESKAFEAIQESIFNKDSVKFDGALCFKKASVTVELPVRVNWGGGWSDTPPYCNENGGTVINAAIKLNGRLPIVASVKRLNKKCIVLSTTDSNDYCEFTEISPLQDYNNPFDPFALHKAALIACGIIPTGNELSLDELLERLGGGLYLSTCAVGIPRGSGLGTSSILAGACVKALLDIMGVKTPPDEVCEKVLCMEQIMSTGGGWQDQVGGIVPGIKYITTAPGAKQKVICKPVDISAETIEELEKRFVIIYTGQRRLARNLLREVMGRYIGGNRESVAILYEIQQLAAVMKFELEKGDIDKFAELLNKQWELSKRLDSGCTNTCIDQIFMACEDFIDGKMICGAGGGGFLQVILKKDATVEELQRRLKTVFGDSGVDVWECSFA